MSKRFPVPVFLAVARGGVALAAALLAGSVSAQPGTAAPERSAKAAFMYRFLGYTEFPADAFGNPAAPIVIGVVGSQAMALELARLAAGRSVHQRPVMVRQFRDNEDPGAAHLLFVAGADRARAARVLRQAPAGAMLLVTECGECLQAGSVINFRMVARQLRFDVSLAAAGRHHLVLSSRLLTLANYVSKGAS